MNIKCIVEISNNAICFVDKKYGTIFKGVYYKKQFDRKSEYPFLSLSVYFYLALRKINVRG